MFYDDGCGGYGISQGLKRLQNLFSVQETDKLKWDASYNIRPGSYNPIVTSDGKDRQMNLMKWGLIPHFWKGEPNKVAYSNINARAETVDQKPFFKSAFASKRCLVPCEYFMEWALNKADPKLKEPYIFEMKDKELFAIGGIYDQWLDAEEHPLETYSIITCEPNSLVNKYHSRMPYIVPKQAWDEWMDPSSKSEQLKKSIKPFPAGEMLAIHVGRAIGNSRLEGEELIKPVPEVPYLQSKPAWQT